MSQNPDTALAVVESQPLDTPSQALAPASLFGAASPVAVIGKASEIASALKAVLQAQGLISKIQGREYPRCEAWTLLGTMLGIFPVLQWTRQVDGGWEARVEARSPSLGVIGAAEAQCLRSERNWKDRDDFALRSMAQTRATAKALRMPLGFVMTLAGYEATPAEEMDWHSRETIDARQAAREAEAVKHTSYPVHEGYPQGVKGPKMPQDAPGTPPATLSQSAPQSGPSKAPVSQPAPKIGQPTDKLRIDHPKSQEDKIAAFEHWLSKEFGPQGIPWCEGYLHLHSIGGSDMNPALGLTADGVKETLKVLTAVDLDQIPKCGKTPQEGWTNFRQRLADFIEANADNHPDLAPASHSSMEQVPGQASNPVGSVSAGPAQTPSVAEHKGDRVNTPGAVSHPLPDIPHRTKGQQPKGSLQTQGVLEAFAVKHSKPEGKWVRYGIKIGQDWYNTFDRKLGALAESLKGKTVTAVYIPNTFDGKPSLDLIDMEPY